MARDKFSDECSGCRPVIFEVGTGKALPDDDPKVKALMRAWAATTLDEREAWHRVTCLNSRDPFDMNVCKNFMDRVQAISAAH